MGSRNARAKRRCAKKITYTSLQAAEAAAWSLRRKGSTTPIGSYKCGICGGFHVGHTPKKIRRAIRAKRKETA